MGKSLGWAVHRARCFLVVVSVKRLIYRIGQYLIRVNYTPCDPVIHDLRHQNKLLREKVSQLSIKLAIEKTRRVI